MNKILTFGKVENSKFSKKQIYTFSKNSLKLIKNNQKIKKIPKSETSTRKIPKNENQISKLIKLIKIIQFILEKSKFGKCKLIELIFENSKYGKSPNLELKFKINVFLFYFDETFILKKISKNIKISIIYRKKYTRSFR